MVSELQSFFNGLHSADDTFASEGNFSLNSTDLLHEGMLKPTFWYIIVNNPLILSFIIWQELLHFNNTRVS